MLFDNKENTLKLKRQSNSFKSKHSDSKFESKRESQSQQIQEFRKEFNEAPQQDLSVSLVSRISLGDIPTFQEQPEPERKQQQRLDLKKWDRVFKN